MKIKKLLAYCMAIALLSLVTSSCKNDDDEKNYDKCGCHAKPLYTINGEEGTITYDNGSVTENNPYPNTYRIELNTSTPSTNIYIVCNEDFIPIQIKKLAKDENKSISVVFHGKVSEKCQGIMSTANYSFFRINLTQIKIK
ncbi:hypothetical protein MWN41_01300 [Ornithobacterium rhinotracheale]|uniref:hypothetical protein n=1 Tax=Ornithobacterium rhinotracheale TaxID=28251 RepID=UPI001FF2A3CE|nr:hypothetical protein [Ornithobacterium rhinotracheale]MCK0201650.1 hypothetical protein [Ornithobacterium rhinotracheale]MCK0205453.1 hypothetical protein [Ornithobacterium rhinotracheale]